MNAVRQITDWPACSNCGHPLTDFTGEWTCTSCGIVDSRTAVPGFSADHTAPATHVFFPDGAKINWSKNNYRQQVIFSTISGLGIEPPGDGFINRCLDYLDRHPPDFSYRYHHLARAMVLLEKRLNSESFSIKTLTTGLKLNDRRLLMKIASYLREGLSIKYKPPVPAQFVPGILEKLPLTDRMVKLVNTNVPVVFEHVKGGDPRIAAAVAVHLVLRHFYSVLPRELSRKTVAKLMDIPSNSLYSYYHDRIKPVVRAIRQEFKPNASH